MSTWQEDKRWSDRYLTEIKSILGCHLIGEPPIEEDQEHNTDLIVLKMDPVRIGVRIRREEYYNKYPCEFTIRAGRPNGHKTELTKIVEGWGDYFFYGFGGEVSLLKWTLCDLKVFRLWFNRQLYTGIKPGIAKDNHDNSSNFLAFKFTELPNEFVLASSD